MTSSDHFDLDRLLSQMVDGELSDSDEQQLQGFLRDDPNSRERYLRFMRLHADLLWDHGAAAAFLGNEAQTITTVPTVVLSSWKWSPSWSSALLWLMMAAIAGGFVFVGLGRNHEWLTNTNNKAPLIVALDAVQGSAEWGDGVTKLRLDPGSELRLSAGILLLEGDDSSAQLRFDDGTRITISGDAEAEFSQESQKRLRLRRGSLTADVTRQPVCQPLIIETPTARVEVLGTLFTLVASNERTALDVERGSVRMERLHDGRQVEVQDQRRAVASLDPSAEMQALRTGIPPDAWRQTFAEPPPAICKGTWLAADGENPPRVRGAPCLAGRKKSGEPIVHYGITARSGLETRLVTLRQNSVVVVRYRLASEAPLRIMLGTNQPGGSFGGNFEFKQSSHSVMADGDGWRTMTVPLREFRPLVNRFPQPLDGSQVALLMFNSHGHDVSLEVCELEIRASAP